MRGVVARGLGVAASLLATTAHGAAPGGASARLELERTDEARSCIEEKRLVRAVERRLRRAAFDPAQEATLFVHVALSRREAEFVAAIELSDAEGVLGRRELATLARHCSALDDSLALVVALLVESPPERVVPPPAAPAQVGAQPGVPPAPEEASLPAPAEVSEHAPTTLEIPKETFAPREPLRFALRGSVLGAAGLLPNVALGPELGFGVHVPHGPWVRLSVEAYIRQTESVSSDAGARLARQRFGLEVCAPEVGFPWLALCLGQRVGAFSAAGFGFDHSFDRLVVTFALVGGPDLTFPLGRYLSLSFGARLELPLSRHRVDAGLSDGSARELFAEAPVSATLRAGLELEL